MSYTRLQVHTSIPKASILLFAATNKILPFTGRCLTCNAGTGRTLARVIIRGIKLCRQPLLCTVAASAAHPRHCSSACSPLAVSAVVFHQVSETLFGRSPSLYTGRGSPASGPGGCGAVRSVREASACCGSGLAAQLSAVHFACHDTCRSSSSAAGIWASRKPEYVRKPLC